MSSVDAYPQVEQVDGIRILELTRLDASEGRLTGRLVPVRLSHRPDYCAISYAWGKGSFTKSILLEGGCSHAISKTLFEALREIASNAKDIRVWVDQICINQKDPHEKAHQVSLMAEIYSQARQVIAWLGVARDNSGAGLKLLRVLGEIKDKKSSPDEEHRRDRLAQLFKELTEEVSVEDIFNFNNVAWQGAISLVQRSWFRRLWIVQEVALSANLEFRCGEYTISGGSFFAAVRVIASIISFPPRFVMDTFENAHRLGSLRDQLSSGQPHSYPQLAHILSGWNCSDDRDRLNALMGIVFRRTSSPWFTPSYIMTEEELYERFAAVHISITGGLDILHFAGDSRVLVASDAEACKVLSLVYPKYKICSWAPDWRIRTRPLPLSPKVRTDGFNGFFSTCSKPTYTFDESRRKLHVHGLMVDEIAVIGPPLVDGIHTRISLDHIFNAWFELAREAFNGAEDLEKRFASTLLMNGRMSAPEPSTPHLSPSQHFAHFESWGSRILANMEKPAHLSKEAWHDIRANPIQDGVDNAIKYGYEAIEICCYRSFFITRSGRLGLGPAQVSPGSSIYLIHGLKTPFVLTKAPQDGDYYVRGECYVEGFMDGNTDRSERDVDLTLI